MNLNKYQGSLLERLRVLLEFVSLLYIGAMLVYRVLQVYATYYHPSFRPWYDLVEMFLLRAGIVLTAANVLFRTGWRKSRRVFLLYGICMIDAFASFLASGGVVSDWKQQLMREIITVVLFYCAAHCERENLMRQMLHIFFWLCLLIWSALCCLSLCQFALMIGLEGPRASDILLLCGRGFFEHRLFGVFHPLEYAAVTSLMLMLASAYFFTVSGSRVERTVLVILNIPVLIYQVLSGSRNAQLALYLCLFLGIGITCLKGNGFLMAGRHRIMKSFFIAIVAVAVAHFGGFLIQRTAERIPALFDAYSGPLAYDLPGQEQTQPNEEDEQEGRLLERVDIKENIATNRIWIWREYISLWREYGLIGLSSTYDHRYILKHHPDMFICAYMRDKKPDEYAAGKAYHTHNGYLKTLASTGYLGFALLMLFLIGSVRDVWKALRRPGNVSPQLLFPLMIVVAGCSSAMFDLELFFIFNSISYIFWLALGITIKQAETAYTDNTKPIIAGNDTGLG